jgi:signal transduction histidine kinase
MRPWSLRLKLTALLVGLVTASILGASAVHRWFALRALTADVQVRAAAIASQFAYSVSSPHELADRDALALEIRNILKARPTLRWVEVYAAEAAAPAVIASTGQPGHGAALALVRRALTERRTVTAAGTAERDEAWLAAAPIYLDDTPAGAVALAMSHEGAQRLAAGLWQQLLFVLLGAGLTIVAGLAIFMERAINRPIRDLLKTMAAAEAGDLAALPPRGRRDEMGDLAHGLARMLGRIRAGHEENLRLLQQISRFNQELQGRVGEATRELVARNEALARANELLFDLQRQLNRAQRLATLGHLTARMAHEIGTPLNSVALHLQLLARSPALTEQDRRRLKTIDGQIQRLVTTVQELLTSTRGEAHRPEPTDLNGIVRGITDLMAPVLSGKGIASCTALEEALPKVVADPHRIQQVLLNLVTNAVDAMPDGGALRVATRQEGRWAVMAVADTGRGIPPEARERIFEPFFTTKDRRAGAGLGLAICRQIIDAHGGTLAVGETSGGGATFEVRLPLAGEEAGP